MLRRRRHYNEHHAAITAIWPLLPPIGAGHSFLKATAAVHSVLYHYRQVSINNIIKEWPCFFSFSCQWSMTTTIATAIIISISWIQQPHWQSKELFAFHRQRVKSSSHYLDLDKSSKQGTSTHLKAVKRWWPTSKNNWRDNSLRDENATATQQETKLLRLESSIIFDLLWILG